MKALTVPDRPRRPSTRSRRRGSPSYNTDEPHTLFLQGRAAFGFGTGGLIGRIMKENPALFDKVGHPRSAGRPRRPRPAS